jgi:flagellar basal-body rod modification protein FlgD
MTTIYPISGLQEKPEPATTTAGRDEQFGQDTFLKLLVAQLKFQDPLKPTDSSEFLAQTAQFTQLETLQKIEKQLDAAQSANEMLAASSMVGRRASYTITDGRGPIGTSVVSIRGSLPKDAPAGSRTNITTEVYNRAGAKVPLNLEFLKTADGWTVQATSRGTAVGSALKLDFDATGDRTGNLSLPASALDKITGTAGGWPANGITLAFGDKDDPTRLQLADGPATVGVTEQNGHDGQTGAGVVTGMHLTVDGPELVIGGQTIPLSSITDISS